MTVDGDGTDGVELLNSDGWVEQGGGTNIWQTTVSGVSIDQFNVDSEVFTTVENVTVTLVIDPAIVPDFV
jgi:hypothetical protein